MTSTGTMPYRDRSHSRERLEPVGMMSNSSKRNCNNDATQDQGEIVEEFLFEHLATLSVSDGIQTAADGMRRLLAMEKSSGIWTQKMIMRIVRHRRSSSQRRPLASDHVSESTSDGRRDVYTVHIVDHENGDIVEQFPLSLIHRPTAFISTDPNELYNNILIYTVMDLDHSNGPPGRGDQVDDEMHIFQCVDVRARDAVESLKALLSGKSSTKPSRTRSDHLPPRTSLVPVSQQISSGREHLRSDHVDGIDDVSTTSSSEQGYERDVTILNRCFDDIELFVGRLQQAAAAYRQLEKRRKSRKSAASDRNGSRYSRAASAGQGDGMLSIRAKPPPGVDFVDILQKFKLSFNLLAKLKSHIHNPNAPELVHFLFTPLALIVDAAQDVSLPDDHDGANNGDKDVRQTYRHLSHDVVVPLLTQPAVQLLTNCLTSKESELWHSLGDCWYMTHDHWSRTYRPNVDDATFKPTFSDGWSPVVRFDQWTHNSRTSGHSTSDRPGRRVSQPASDSSPSPASGDRSTVHPDHIQYHRDLQSRRTESCCSSLSASSCLHTDQHSGRTSAMRDNETETSAHQPIAMVQVTYPRTANNEKELTVVRGEMLEVLDDSRKWWKTRNAFGHIGFVPHTIVTRDF